MITGVISFAAWSFPRTGRYEKRIELPTENYTWVESVNDGDLVVDWQQFSQLSEGKQIFVSVDGSRSGRVTVSRYVKSDNVGYRYNQDYGHSLLHKIIDQKLVGDTVVLSLDRDWVFIGLSLFFEGVFVGMGILGFLWSTKKDAPGYNAPTYSLFKRR